MPLEIHPVLPADMPELFRIQRAAFSAGIAAHLFPRPATPSYIESSIAKHAKSQASEPDVQYLKVIDTELDGRMVAAAKWRINLKERTQEEVEKMLPRPGKEEEGNEAAKAFMAYLRWARSTFMGTKPFFFLHMLVTDPEHHRRGAGALLVKWGTAQADAANLPSFLEASEAGRPLYARLGFAPVHVEVFDLSKYGGEGKDTNTIMIRQPET
ncbi:acyl-CoA N-acyltransferase [Melanomma pulvis-pyrius CBS 109.77]|uniref:Acyl-CoA N-acyltransferase n=1 Tax=Melanomma pulvis-pyrius CBS 109.77 TaxID=1314802 RepID=A0A6A6X9K6_9PLEO|nr:acyl-CoA N-acyltransferase [Melanomma pulvis-pyrius CBS 109.77]